MKERSFEVLKTFVHRGVGFVKGMLIKERNIDPDALDRLIEEGFIRQIVV